MYERSYGYRYAEPGEHATAAEIAKQIRADIKQAVAEGLLPAHWTYSVRSDSNSIDLDVRDCPDAWQDCDGTVPGTRHEHPGGGWTAHACPNVWCEARGDEAYSGGWERHKVLTEDARAAEMTLKRIHGAYNHDGSEIMVDYFDVRYYGVVQFEDDSSREWRAAEKERLAAKKSAREQAVIVGKVANYGRDGRAVVHLLAETAEGKQVLACGARVSAHGYRGRVGEDAAVTCSRCARREASSSVGASR